MVEENIAKFVPSDMRIRITKDIIDAVGIRPLSKMIGVNPKTVYKYKHGTACPTDEKMARILAVMRVKNPNLFGKYLKMLRTSFMRALEEPVGRIRRISEELSLGQFKSSRPKPVRQKFPSTEPAQISKFEIYNRLKLTSPPDRMKLAKILAIAGGMQSFGVKDLAQKANIPLNSVKEYVEKLVDTGFLKESSSGAYQLSVRFML